MAKKTDVHCAPMSMVPTEHKSRGAYIQSRGNFCMMLSYPPRCLKGIPSSNKKHVGSLNYGGGGWAGGGGVYSKKKLYNFAWLTLGMSIKKIYKDNFDTFLQL